MRIGLINTFPSRPYFQHLIYFRYSLERAGHSTNTFFCQGGDLSCYYKKQHPSIPPVINCLQCKLRRNTAKDKGFAVTNYNHSFKSFNKERISDDLYASFKQICINSFSTIHRIEELQDINDFYDKDELCDDIQALSVFYHGVKKWIDSGKLEKVILFNGRMDLMAAARLACENADIGYFCYEGTFFGKGAYLFENTNCLSLKHWKDSCLSFMEKPLTANQTLAAFQILQNRLNRDTDLEWRSYFEKDIKNSKIAVASKVLVLLSSTNEVFGAIDYKSGWHNYLDGVDQIVNALSVIPEDVIVRGHPVWATAICGVRGESIEDIYRSWAIERKYQYISSSSKLDTQFLIKNTENVIINYSSAFFEAAYFNKKIFLTHSGYYDFSGIALRVDHPTKLSCIKEYVDYFSSENNHITRLKKLLRFTYITAYRLPVFLEEMHPQNKLSWNYAINSESVSNKIVEMLSSGKYPYSDFSFNIGEEDEEIDCVNAMVDSRSESIMTENVVVIAPESKLELFPILKFIKKPVPKLMIKLEKLLSKGDYLGI